jgi:predicted RNase H-like HicB family nuclease
MENEIIFNVVKISDGVYTASSVSSPNIVSEGKTIEEVKFNAWDAVICKYDGKKIPAIEFSH